MELLEVRVPEFYRIPVSVNRKVRAILDLSYQQGTSLTPTRYRVILLL